MELIDLQPFESFIRERSLAPERNIPYYVSWVRRFLQATLPSAAVTSEDRLRAFMDQLGRDSRVLDWQLQQAARAVDRLYARLPKATESQVLGRQILRSGTSVGANYHEAYRARSKAEFIAKVGDSLKELEETNYWFALLVESGIVNSEAMARLQDECDQLLAILTAISKKSKAVIS